MGARALQLGDSAPRVLHIFQTGAASSLLWMVPPRTSAQSAARNETWLPQGRGQLRPLPVTEDPGSLAVAQTRRVGLGGRGQT